MIFYVYTYLDPRKPGCFKYNDVIFEHEPFYIGKGHDNRMDDHLNEVLRNHKRSQKGNQLKYNKIRSILKSGNVPIICILKYFNEENETLLFEKALISNIGRIKQDTGPLTNLTDGGDGVLGYKHTEETKNRMRIPKSDEVKDKIKKTLSGVPIGFRGTNDTRLKLSINAKRQTGDKNSVFKTLWINNGIENKRVKDVSPFINSGWLVGRIKWKNK